MFHPQQFERATFSWGKRLRRHVKFVKKRADFQSGTLTFGLVKQTAVISMLLSLGLCLNPFTPSFAKEKAASFGHKVAAGKWTGARLRNPPKGASLAIEVTVDGDVTVLLLNEQSYRQLPVIDRPLFQGKTGDRMSFTIRVSQTGHYSAVIDTILFHCSARVIPSTGSMIRSSFTTANRC